jgi:prophage antirepressor-like protein
MENQLAVFEQKTIRKTLFEGEIYFSVVDIIGVLTDSVSPRDYWTTMKRREPQMPTICRRLKMQAEDGKQRLTDCANTEGVFRILMSVPSPKAEPFKLWLAQVGKQHIDETENPELLTDRQAEIYKAKGYPEEWISRRLQSIEIRKSLTEEWKNRGVKEGQEYSILTAEIAKATFGVTPSEHSKIKGLEKENLRDHMTPIELIFTMLGEESTRIIATNDNAQGFAGNHDAARQGGNIAGGARKKLEKKSGEKVVSSHNFLGLKEGDSATALPENNEKTE